MWGTVMKIRFGILNRILNYIFFGEQIFSTILPTATFFGHMLMLETGYYLDFCLKLNGSWLLYQFKENIAAFCESSLHMNTGG